MPTRKCLGTNKTTFQSILGVSISVRKYRQKIRNGGDPPPPYGQCLQLRRFFVGGASLSPALDTPLAAVDGIGRLGVLSGIALFRRPVF